MKLEELAGAIGLNVGHILPSTSEDLKAKIAQIAKDPELARYLPTRFQGPNGTWMDRFGNEIDAPKEWKAKLQQKVAYEQQQKAWYETKQAYKGYKSAAQEHQAYAPIKDQKLIQRIGVASNMNVILTRSYGSAGKHHALTCEKCGVSLLVYDEVQFVESRDTLMGDILKFCGQHRHEDKPAEVPVVTGRRFREDD